MKEFFTHGGGIIFVPFGTLHLIVLFSTILISILIYIYQTKLKKYTFNKNINYYFAIILLIPHLIYYPAFILLKTFDFKLDLPLHYCYITGFLYIYMLIFRKEKMFNWLFYSVFMCTVASIIWMILDFSYDRFMFYRYIIAHSGLFVINLYCFYVLNYPVNKKGMLTAFIYSNTLFIIVAIYNAIFNTNYIMSKSLPPFIYEWYPFTRKIDYPIIWLEITGIIIMLIAYQLVKHEKAK